ncbi:MAG: DUF4038 domain-containing protein [Dysgonamonadaceae bacterium]|nr:DUF4038 domain-containing protein [Dysgonamonadaceae bacterium]
MYFKKLSFGLTILCLNVLIASGSNQVNNKAPECELYSMHELSFESTTDDSSFMFPLVSFYKPDGSIIKVDGFYDGGTNYKVRAYCNEKGLWKWELHDNSNFKKTNGAFNVIESNNKGMLKKHPDDGYQFAYDNGEWFLHIGDTGYRYLTDTEPKWKEYFDQACEVGMTKIRTWFSRSRSKVEALFNNERTTLNLPYWQEMDKRIAYAYENYPNVILQLIPFGEDGEELKRYYAGDSLSFNMVRYAQARFSAYPNIYWSISNDKELVNDSVNLTGPQISKSNIDMIGKDMAERNPWGTLITNHQTRHKGYSFVDESWSDVVTLEDIDQLDGRIFAEYRAKGSDPVVLDEDRYEVYRKPEHPRYFFRRLMWASLLSGGHATYGGIHNYLPYEQDSVSYFPKEEWHLFGMQGYFDVGLEGADDFKYISQFFKETGYTLAGMMPDDALTGNKPQEFKCIHNDSVYIIYLANPDRSGSILPKKNEYDFFRYGNESSITPTVTVELPKHPFAFKWYDPSSGGWSNSGEIEGGKTTISAPDQGDWILLLIRT